MADSSVVCSTRGPMPATKPAGPRVLSTCCSAAMGVPHAPWHCNCVLTTSSGVVNTAAVAPATPPSSMGWLMAVWPGCCSPAFLSASYTENWMVISGTSRSSVAPNPQYSPRSPCFCHTLAAACHTSVNTYACTRCLSTSLGTRTSADATAAVDADTMCATMSRLSLLKWVDSMRFMPSSTLKNRKAAGSVPSTAPARPRYRSPMPKGPA
mmetsp:Transcript_18450/g.46669  ORF Transcript_18450/g.46669 Transcript_18450/m.46669 type:complete len:210 (+) Transcript_18450:1926-2555(+)